MINQNTTAMIILSVGMLFGLMSCEGMGGESIYDLDKAGEIDAIKKEIIEIAGDISVFEISLVSKEELETSIDDITIITNSEASEGTLNRENFTLSEEIKPTFSVIDSEFSVRVYQKNDPKKISEIDFTVIEKNVEAAKKQIPSSFVDHALFEYTIEFDDNKRSDRFTINAVMEGENNHLQGNDLVTNYYEFLFEMDENGAVIMLGE